MAIVTSGAAGSQAEIYQPHPANLGGNALAYFSDSQTDIAVGPATRGGWNFVCFTQDASGGTVYCWPQGQALIRTIIAGGTTDGVEIYIGSFAGSGKLDGWLQDVVIFKRILRFDEIVGMYQTGAIPRDPMVWLPLRSGYVANQDQRANGQWTQTGTLTSDTDRPPAFPGFLQLDRSDEENVDVAASLIASIDWAPATAPPQPARKARPPIDVLPAIVQPTLISYAPDAPRIVTMPMPAAPARLALEAGGAPLGPFGWLGDSMVARAAPRAPARAAPPVPEVAPGLLDPWSPDVAVSPRARTGAAPAVAPDALPAIVAPPLTPWWGDVPVAIQWPRAPAFLPKMFAPLGVGWVADAPAVRAPLSQTAKEPARTALPAPAAAALIPWFDTPAPASSALRSPVSGPSDFTRPLPVPWAPDPSAPAPAQSRAAAESARPVFPAVITIPSLTAWWDAPILAPFRPRGPATLPVQALPVVTVVTLVPWVDALPAAPVARRLPASAPLDVVAPSSLPWGFERPPEFAGTASRRSSAAPEVAPATLGPWGFEASRRSPPILTPILVARAIDGDIMPGIRPAPWSPDPSPTPARAPVALVRLAGDATALPGVIAATLFPWAPEPNVMPRTRSRFVMAQRWMDAYGLTVRPPGDGWVAVYDEATGTVAIYDMPVGTMAGSD